jgi:hypothetical protein
MKVAVLYLVLAVFALGAWIVHQFAGEAMASQLGVTFNPYYFNLPAAFWSTVLFSLFLALGLEGIGRWRRCRLRDRAVSAIVLP